MILQHVERRAKHKAAHYQAALLLEIGTNYFDKLLGSSDSHALHDDVRERLVGTIDLHGGDGVDNIETGNDFAEYGVAMWQWRVFLHDEELAAIGIGTGIGHGHSAFDITGLVGNRVRIQFIGEFVAGTAHTGTSRIAALDHEARDDTMEDEVIVETLTSQSDEILDGVRRVGIICLKDDGAFVSYDSDCMHKVFDISRSW